MFLSARCFDPVCAVGVGMVTTRLVSPEEPGKPIDFALGKAETGAAQNLNWNAQTLMAERRFLC